MRAMLLLVVALLVGSCAGVEATPTTSSTSTPSTTVADIDPGPGVEETTLPPDTTAAPQRQPDTVEIEIDGFVYVMPGEACSDDPADRATLLRVHDDTVDELMGRLASIRSGWPTTTVPLDDDEPLVETGARLGPPIYAMALLLEIENRTAIEMAERERALGSAQYPVPDEIAAQITDWLAIGAEIVDALPDACEDR